MKVYYFTADQWDDFVTEVEGLAAYDPAAYGDLAGMLNDTYFPEVDGKHYVTSQTFEEIFLPIGFTADYEEMSPSNFTSLFG